MSDDFVKEYLQGVLDSITLVETRFLNISNADEFVSNDEGVLILDSISMRLQIVGELLKKIDKINPDLWTTYPQIEWGNIMKLRDIISHHYDHVDHEIIYDICKNKMSDLQKTIKQILSDKYRD